MPLISVIIPNYNHARYLSERIESVLNQSYQDFELIILDDCSTDRSRDIIESYRSHEKISHIVYNVENSGSTFKQWDKGFGLARGKFIWIAESDDIALKDFLETTLKVIQSDESISLVSTNSNYIDGEGNVFQRGVVAPPEVKVLSCYNTESKSPYIIYEGREFVKDFLCYYNFICNASAVLFRYDVAMHIAKDYKEFKLNGDWLFWINMCYGKKIAVVNSCHNNFRFHASNVRNSVKYIQSIEEGARLLMWTVVKFQLGNNLKIKTQLRRYFDYLKVLYNCNVVQIREVFNDEITKYIPDKKLELFYLCYIHHPFRRVYFIIKGLASKL